ncbi:hypothetical protein [Anderseniella sp. Alg231-50]|uniref:hypothetical protein n=1 Tax=Anderseniella sp. Alg231-50 TaxID=1922226 RepID=UPI000D55C432
MTMQEAIALQPAWVEHWLRVLFLCAFILPAALLIWKQTRLTAIIVVIASVAGGFSTARLYDAVGYVKLLGLPHIIFWTPLVIYLVVQLRKPDIPKIPRMIMAVVLGAITISLTFDYVDVFRYLLGERTPLEGTV